MKKMRERLVVKKVAHWSVIINAVQILLMLGIAITVMLGDGVVISNYYVRAVLVIAAGVVSWGAFVDIREALMTQKTTVRMDMLEDALEQLEQLNIKLRGQRHDFMNHLQVVFSLLELEDYKEASDYIERVYGDIRRVSRTLKTAHPAINALLAAKVGDCEARGVHVDLQIESPWTDLPVESWEMCRVLGNLIDNAMDAMKDTTAPRLLIRLSESVQSYTFAIANNGPMIQPSIAERIFLRGFSTKGEGRGMGLSIVRGIMESGGGRLTLRSDAHETRFEGTLPKPSAAPQALSEAEKALK